MQPRQVQDERLRGGARDRWCTRHGSENLQEHRRAPPDRPPGPQVQRRRRLLQEQDDDGAGARLPRLPDVLRTLHRREQHEGISHLSLFSCTFHYNASSVLVFLLQRDDGARVRKSIRVRDFFPDSLLLGGFFFKLAFHGFLGGFCTWVWLGCIVEGHQRRVLRLSGR